MRSVRGPSGIPVGRALDIPAGIVYDDLRDAVDAINRVHGDGELPTIPVLVTGVGTPYGRFLFDPTTGEPVSISISASEPYPRLSLLHEVGHFLDWSMFGRSRDFGSNVDADMHSWASAVSKSRAFEIMHSMQRRGIASVDDGGMTLLTPRQLLAVRTALRAEELWARSYAQYVALNARSAALKLSEELASIRARYPGKVYYPLQWESDDFASIAETIEDLFTEKGWRQ